MFDEADDVKGPYSRVYNEMWASASFRSLSERGRYLFFYLLTGPETSALPGVVRTNMASMAHDLEWPLEVTERHFAELTEQGMAVYDPAGMVWLPNGLRFNAPINQNVVKSWAHTWRKIPACPLKAQVYDRLRAHCARRGQSWLTAFESGCKRPTVSGRLDTDKPQKPAARNDSANHSANGLANDRPNLQLQTATTTTENTNSAPAAQAPVCVREGLTSDSPEPTTAAEPPPSAKTAPSALPDDADGDTGPLTSRGASLPLFRPTAPAPQPAPSPAPVVVLSPEPCPASPPVASPVPASAAPVTAAPSPSGAASASRPTSAREAAIREVFDFWQATVWKSRALYNDKRRTRIAARLAEGFSVDDLKTAARGATFDDWLMGRREGSRAGGFRDVETVFRDAAQVERLIALARQHEPKPATPRPAANDLDPVLPPLSPEYQRRCDEARAKLPEHVRAMKPAEFLAAFAAGKLGLSNGAPAPMRKAVGHV